MTRKLPNTNIPYKYSPKTLSKKDRATQLLELRKSRKLYQRGIYHTRKTLKSYKHIKSPHIRKAIAMYGVSHMRPTTTLARKTKCSLKSLRKIVNKGRGAYYSSGSRPNQTAESWGVARLASALTGQKASQVDYHLLEEGCAKGSKPLVLANKFKATHAK